MLSDTFLRSLPLPLSTQRSKRILITGETEENNLSSCRLKTSSTQHNALIYNAVFVHSVPVFYYILVLNSSNCTINKRALLSVHLYHRTNHGFGFVHAALDIDFSV